MGSVRALGYDQGFLYTNIYTPFNAQISFEVLP